MSISKAVVMFDKNDTLYEVPLLYFVNSKKAAMYLKENKLVNQSTLLTSIETKIRGASNKERSKNHPSSNKTSLRKTAFNYRWAFYLDLPINIQKKADELKDTVNKDGEPSIKKKEIYNDDLIIKIIHYLKEDWGRNEIAFYLGVHSDLVSRINNGKYIVSQNVIDSTIDYYQGMVIQDNSSNIRKALIRSRIATPIIMKTTIYDENNNKTESYIIFRSIMDLVNTNVITSSFASNLTGALKGRKAGHNGHVYSKIEWYSFKDAVIKKELYDESLFKVITNKYEGIFILNDYLKSKDNKNLYVIINDKKVYLSSIYQALEISYEHLNMLVHYYNSNKVNDGVIKSKNFPYKKS